MKKIIGRLLVLCGIGLLLFPMLSDMYLYKKQQEEIKLFEENFKTESAQSPDQSTFNMKKAQLKAIGILYIPKIKLTLPIYGNTNESTLEDGAGLMEGTSPLGTGKGGHSVITGHSGLSVGRLFTGISELNSGDKFFIKNNHEIMAYAVDNKKTVLPDKVESLYPVKGHDYVTLLTCTPLYINTHRLLVRGERVPYQNENIHSSFSILNYRWMLGALFLILIYIIISFIKEQKKKA